MAGKIEGRPDQTLAQAFELWAFRGVSNWLLVMTAWLETGVVLSTELDKHMIGYSQMKNLTFLFRF